MCWHYGCFVCDFQIKGFNVPSAERHLRNYVKVLEGLKTDPFSGGYMIQLQGYHSDELGSIDHTRFEANAKQYLQSLIAR